MGESVFIRLLILYMNSRILTTGAISLALLASIVAPAFAQTGSVTGAAGNTTNPGEPTNPGNPGPKPPTGGKLNLVCVQAAVDAREAAIGTAFSTFAAGQSAALAARKTALHDAWGNADGSIRRPARDKAWSDYRIANRAVMTALRAARETAWGAFRSASAACGVEVVEQPAGEGWGSLGL
jgi:hypothetical protein